MCEQILKKHSTPNTIKIMWIVLKNEARSENNSFWSVVKKSQKFSYE